MNTKRMNIKQLKYSDQSTHSFLTNGLKVRRVYGDGCGVLVILMVLFFAFTLIAIMLTSIYSIYDDIQIKFNAEPIEAKASGQCQRSQHKGQNSIYVDCDLTIDYDHKRYRKSFHFIDFTTQEFVFKAVKHKNNPDLITVDLALDTIARQLFFGILLGIGASIMFFVAFGLASRRIKLICFLREINRGYGELALLCVSERKEDIEYFNRVKNKPIAMEYGAFVIIESEKYKYRPFCYFRDNQQYVLIAQNKHTGNFLIVDTALKRLKISEQQRSEVYDALNAATIY